MIRNVKSSSCREIVVFVVMVVIWIAGMEAGTSVKRTEAEDSRGWRVGLNWIERDSNKIHDRIENYRSIEYGLLSRRMHLS